MLAAKDTAAELAAMQKQIAAMEKKHAADLKKAQDGVRADLAKALGVAPADDPAAVANTLRADLTKWQTAATRAAVRAEAVAMIPDAHNASRVLQLLDVSGVEFDADAGALKGADVLKERIDALRKSDPYLFKAAPHAGDSPPVTRPAPVIPAPVNGNPVDEYARAIASGADLKTLRTLRDKALATGAPRALTA